MTEETIQAFSSLPIPDPHCVAPAVPDYYGTLKNFQVEKKIGQGQFSVVFRARCVVDGRIVALKKIQVMLYSKSSLSLIWTYVLRFLT